MGLLGERDFRALWVGAGLSQFATRMTMFALPLFAIQESSATPWQVGLLTTLSTLAFLVVGLPAGVIVDRVRQRRLLVWTDLGRALMVASLAATSLLNSTPHLSQLYLIAAVTGVLAVFFDVAHQSYLPHLIRPEQLVEGNAKLTSTMAVAQITGPVLAGAAIAAGGLVGGALLITAGFVGSAGYLTRIRAPDRVPPPQPRRRLGREIAAGLVFVARHPALRVIALSGALYNLFALVIQSMVAVRLVDELGLSAASASLYFSAGGVGGVAGALFARRLADRFGQDRMVWLAQLATAPFAFLTPLMSRPGQLWLAATGYLIVWFGATVSNVVQVSFRQRLCPAPLLGRMNATMRFVLWGAMPLGGLLGGGLGATVGVRGALWLGAAGFVLSCLPLLSGALRRDYEGTSTRGSAS